MHFTLRSIGPLISGVFRARAVTLVAAALLATLAAGCGEDGPSGPGTNDGTCGHLDFAGGVDLQSAGTPVFHQFGFQTTGDITIPLGGTLPGVEVTFLDGDGQPIVIPNDCDIMRVETDFLDASIAEMQREPGQRWRVDFTGKKVGTTTVRVELWHTTHRHFRSEPIQVTVTPVR